MLIKKYNLCTPHTYCPIVCKSSFKPVQQNTDSYSTFEHVILRTQSRQTRLTIVNIYRPPNSNMMCFFDEFASMLDTISSTKEPVLVCGDFNIHWQNTHDINTRKLADLLIQHDLIQHVKSPTHISGNTIDLIMTRASDKITSFADVSRLVSDHLLVSTTLDLTKDPIAPVPPAFRKTKDINLDSFKLEIQSKLQCTQDNETLDSLVEHFNSSVKAVLDTHAPIQQRKTKKKKKQYSHGMTMRFILPSATDELSSVNGKDVRKIQI